MPAAGTNDDTISASLAREWASFRTPPARPLCAVPQPGTAAPRNENLVLPTDRPTLIVFLRHCGCVYAEQVFNRLTAISSTHKDAVHCVAVSHSSQEATERWVLQVGGTWETEMVVDEDRELYAQYGLGISNTWHVLNPASLYRAFQKGKNEGRWNRPTESGTRWQVGGAFAIDRDGVVCWSKVMATFDDVPDLDAALTAVGLDPRRRKRRKGTTATATATATTADQ